MSFSVQSIQTNVIIFSKDVPLQSGADQGERLSEEILPPLLQNSQDLRHNRDIYEVF